MDYGLDEISIEPDVGTNSNARRAGVKGARTMRRTGAERQREMVETRIVISSSKPTLPKLKFMGEA